MFYCLLLSENKYGDDDVRPWVAHGPVVLQ